MTSVLPSLFQIEPSMRDDENDLNGWLKWESDLGFGGCISGVSGYNSFDPPMPSFARGDLQSKSSPSSTANSSHRAQLPSSFGENSCSLAKPQNPYQMTQCGAGPYAPHYRNPVGTQIPNPFVYGSDMLHPSDQFQNYPTQFANQYVMPGSLPLEQKMTPAQFYNLFAHFQQLLKTQNLEVDEKKRKTTKQVGRKIRQTRPKVVESKGAVQCRGRNRKKGTQCRNAALMEYIGPRPIYCAEHIELDPESLYEKCKSSYQKEPGDNKGCKEVVLKEFGLCYKHYPDKINEMIKSLDYETVRKHHVRIGELVIQLESEAAAAKKKDSDLYQRKNKLIPKFHEMRRLISLAAETLNNMCGAGVCDIPPEHATAGIALYCDANDACCGDSSSLDSDVSPQMSPSYSDEDSHGSLDDPYQMDILTIADENVGYYQGDLE